VPEILQAPSPEGWSYPAVGESNPRELIRVCHAREELTANKFEESAKSLPSEWSGQVREYANNMRSAIAKLHAWLQGKEIGPQLQ